MAVNLPKIADTPYLNLYCNLTKQSDNVTMTFPVNSSLQCFRTAALSMVTLNMESRNPMRRVYAENRSKMQNLLGVKGLKATSLKGNVSGEILFSKTGFCKQTKMFLERLVIIIQCQFNSSSPTHPPPPSSAGKIVPFQTRTNKPWVAITIIVPYLIKVHVAHKSLDQLNFLSAVQIRSVPLKKGTLNSDGAETVHARISLFAI